MEQILEEKLGMSNVGYIEMIAKEMLPFRMVIMGTSTFDVKMEILAYWYHSQWRDARF